MKHCNGCAKSVPIEDFYWKFKSRGIRQSRCKRCAATYKHENYIANRTRIVTRLRVSNLAAVTENRQRIWDYLIEHPCVDCGERDPIVLEFDHVRGEKSFTIGSASRAPISWTKIIAEIAKCDVRCANCHRRKTAKQFGWYKHIAASSVAA